MLLKMGQSASAEQDFTAVIGSVNLVLMKSTGLPRRQAETLLLEIRCSDN